MKGHPSPFSDLFLVLLWTIGTLIFILIPPLNETFMRMVFAPPTILFIPGYVLIAALFPGTKDLEGLERIALSFGLSIAVVPLIGLGLNYTPWGIRLEPILLSLVLFIAAMTMIAAYRRMGLSPEERFTVPFRAFANDAKEALIPAESSRMERVLSIVLFVSILLAIGATVYVIVVPKEGEHFTEFYILGEKGKAADYPREIEVGSEYSVIIGIGNHEYRDMTYTVEFHAMNLTFDPVTNKSIENGMQMLEQWSVTVPHNSTFEEHWNFSLSQGGWNRLEFLLFNETVPDPSIRGLERINASYRDLHLWIEM
jgi:uncharacterized membrane protein